MIGNRKFTIAIVSHLLILILGLREVITGMEVVTAIGLVVGLFGGTNAAVHFARNSNDPKPAEPKQRNGSKE